MSMKYRNILSPLVVRDKVLKNRLTASNFKKHFIQGPETYPTENTITHLVNKARSGAAIVAFPGIEFDSSRIVTDHYMPPYGVDNEFQQNYICQAVDEIHMFGSLCMAVLDIDLPRSGPGANGREEVIYDVSAVPPTFIMGDPFSEQMGARTPEPYTKEMLHHAVKSSGERCALLKQLGFDGVAFGMTRFLSPISNIREDEYGGSLENRAHFIVELCRSIKTACGSDFLIETMVSEPEPMEGGWTFEDASALLPMIDGLVDIVTAVGHDIDERHVPMFAKEKTPYLEFAAKLRAEVVRQGVSILIQSNGGYLDPNIIEDAIATGKVDLISMARAWISNPDYGTKIYEGRTEDIVPCLRCNKCHRTSDKDPWVDKCSVNPEWGFEHKIERMFTPPTAKRRVAVIGGGPAGINVALRLRKRGHEVVLYEKTDRLGGKLNTANNVSFKWPMQDYKNYLIRQVGLNGIDVRLNTAPDIKQLKDEQYDYVIAAIGSEPIIPPIPGVNSENVIDCISTYDNVDKIGQHVVVIGGGEIGVETGMYLAECGRQVTVLEMSDRLAADCTPVHYRAEFIHAWEKLSDNLSMKTNAKASAISNDGVTYMNAEGEEILVPADTVVLAAGLKSKRQEALSFFDAGNGFYMLGDCKKVANILWLNQDALGIANLI